MYLASNIHRTRSCRRNLYVQKDFDMHPQSIIDKYSRRQMGTGENIEASFIKCL